MIVLKFNMMCVIRLTKTNFFVNNCGCRLAEIWSSSFQKVFTIILQNLIKFIVFRTSYSKAVLRNSKSKKMWSKTSLLRKSTLFWYLEKKAKKASCFFTGIFHSYFIKFDNNQNFYIGYLNLNEVKRLNY